ncbi:Gp49 family protein [Paraburkholderia metrosideri]|uniref:Gp49 family protein n=1 Tax=Paraburkholderia metrosideri TaxID=580937 RepID=A0ABW9DSS2_9BURK
MNMATNTPLTDEQSTEAAIQRAGKTAPRVTLMDIEAVVTSEFYFTASDGVFGASNYRPISDRSGVALGLLTFCVLVLRNGFTVTGESACASPENFDAQIGCDIARKNAREKVWALEGYLLKQRLHVVE